jgi:hypothetical protein
VSERDVPELDDESPSSWPSPDPYHELLERRARRSWRGVDWAVVGAVAAVLVALALLAQVMSLSRRLDDANGTGQKALAAGFDRAGHAHGARRAALTTDQGAKVARIVLLPDGTGYLKNDDMAALDPGHTYQLWATSQSAGHKVAISEGVLGPNPGATAFRASPGVTGFFVTVEPAGGATRPTQAPYAEAPLT